MTAIMPKDEVQKLLDGTTPGPWRVDGDPQNRIVWSPDGNRVCFMAHSSGLNDGRDIATSNLIAAASDLARSLIAAYDEIERLRADAQAAVALVVEQAAETIGPKEKRPCDCENCYCSNPDDAQAVAAWDERKWAADAIRALAPTDGLALVAELRAERDAAREALMNAGIALHVAKRERDRLAADNVALQTDVRTYQDIVRDMTAQVEALTRAMESIARNTCCDGCQEAARVARAALAAQAPATQTGE